MKIKKIVENGIKHTYDIEVENEHHYIMENGTVSHNTISAICAVYECIEPQISNLFKRETLSGEFVTINKYLIEDLKKMNLWNTNILNAIKQNEGSIQNIPEIPDELKQIYKTVWEIKQKWLIDHGKARGIYIDQSQSLNLFMAEPTIDKLSSMYYYLWESKMKTSYYLRSKAATKINKTTIDSVSAPINTEEPEICESCT